MEKKRLIEANELLKEARRCRAILASLADIVDIEILVADAPTVDAVEVVHGRWIEKYEKVSWCEDDVERFFECSICGCISGYDSPYCPGCGASMRDGDGNG